MADGKGQLGAVQRVEVKMANAFGIEAAAQLGRDRGRDKLAGGGVIVQSLEQPVHPCRNGGAAHRRHLAGLRDIRSEEHTSELQSLMRISYAVFCLKKKKTLHNTTK